MAEIVAAYDGCFYFPTSQINIRHYSLRGRQGTGKSDSFSSDLHLLDPPFPRPSMRTSRILSSQIAQKRRNPGVLAPVPLMSAPVFSPSVGSSMKLRKREGIRLNAI
jgi:hypothetical protein